MSWTVHRSVPSVDDVLQTPALLAALSGLALGLGLIVAIGAQNAFVLRQGLRLEHVTAVVTGCAASDLALLGAGAVGAVAAGGATLARGGRRAGAAAPPAPCTRSPVTCRGPHFPRPSGFLAA